MFVGALNYLGWGLSIHILYLDNGIFQSSTVFNLIDWPMFDVGKRKMTKCKRNCGYELLFFNCYWNVYLKLLYLQRHNNDNVWHLWYEHPECHSLYTKLNIKTCVIDTESSLLNQNYSDAVNYMWHHCNVVYGINVVSKFTVIAIFNVLSLFYDTCACIHM